MNKMTDYVKSPYANYDTYDILSAPVSVLLGVNEKIAELLEKFEIFTVFDLAASKIFKSASDIVDASEEPSSLYAQFQRLPADTLDRDVEKLPIGDLPDLAVSKLAGIGANLLPRVKNEMDVHTIRDFSLWPPYRAACVILNSAYNIYPSADPEAPPELLPVTGVLPVEQVYYPVTILADVPVSSSSEWRKFLSENPSLLKYLAGQRDLLEQAGSTELSVSLDNMFHLIQNIDLPTRAKTLKQIDITAEPDNKGFSQPATGALLTFSQSWYSHGVTLGQLLHSIALAPGECTRVAVIDWSRMSSAEVAEHISQEERLQSSMLQKRSISEVTKATAMEIQEGESTSSTTSHSLLTGAAGAGSYMAYVFSGSGGTGQNYGRAQSYAKTSGERDLTAEMRQNIRNSMHQNASSSRTRRASIVKEVSQEESEHISTRVVTNYNHMHALSIHYYEVVQIYRVMTQLEKCERVLFIPMAPITFTEEVINRYRSVLIAVADSERTRTLIEHACGEIVISMSLERMFEHPDRMARIKAIKWFESTIAEYEARLDPRLETMRANREVHIERKTKDYLPDETTWCAEEKNIFQDIMIEASSLSGLPLSTNPNNISLPSGVKLHNIAWSKQGKKDIEAVVIYWKDNDTDNGYQETAITNDDNVGNPENLTKWAGSADDSNVQHFELSIADISRIAIRRGDKANYSAAEKREEEPRIRVRMQFFLGNDTYFDLDFSCWFPKDTDEATLLRFSEPIALDRLQQVLNENQMYYSQHIWMNTDPQIFIMHLAKYEYPQGMRVTQYIDPIPVAIHGNYVGFRWHHTDDIGWKDWKNAKTESGTRIDFSKIEQDWVALPTGGTFAEAVLGRYNSAEKLDISRFWNWQDSPIPILPPEIAPISAGSRATTEDITPGSLDQPIINIQTPPSLPDPTGMSAVLNTLATANMFRDMSGLADTIRLVQGGIDAATQGAIAGAEQAGENMAAYLGSLKSSGRTNYQKPAWSDSSTNPSVMGGVANAAARRDAETRQQGTPAQPESGASGSGSSSHYDNALGAMTGETGVYAGGGNESNTTEGESGTGGSSNDIEEWLSDVGPEDFAYGRILFANFTVNDDTGKLTEDHMSALDQLFEVLNSNSEAYIESIVGRASQTGPEANNESLSRVRADAVAQYLIAKGFSADKIALTGGLGSKDPLEDADKKELGINRSAVVTYYFWMDNVPEQALKRPEPRSNGYTHWEMKVSVSGGAHYKIGGAFALGELRNRDTNETVSFLFLGGGIGVGAATPGADPGWGDWVSFDTQSPYLFEDFDGALARLTTMGGGCFIGYSNIKISLPLLGVNSLSVGGWNLGTVGLEDSSNVGALKIL